MAARSLGVAGSVVAVCVVCAACLAGVARAGPSGLTEIKLNGANASGSVAFEGNPWNGYFVADKGGRVTLSPYITGDNDDRVVRLYVGLDYQPSGDTNDWRASAIGTGYYEFWYPLTIDYVFPKTTYYVTVVDDEILSAAFTFSADFEPMPAPKIQALQVNALPVSGRVDMGQYAYYTVTPQNEGNVTVKLQMTEGAASVVANLGSYATLGNSQWTAACDTKGTCSLEALYIRGGQTVYVSVWGREGNNSGDDDHDVSVDRYYLSVSE